MISVVFADYTLFEKRNEADTKFAIKSGFADSMAILQKMSCLNYDFKRFEINQEIKHKELTSKLGNLMRDFRSKLKPATADDDNEFGIISNIKDTLIKRSLKSATLLHRKVIRLEGGRKTIMLSAIREENITYSLKQQQKNELASDRYLIKLVLFESKRVADTSAAVPSQPVQKTEEFVFVFRYTEVFSAEEIDTFATDEIVVLKKLVASAINKRLRIRQLADVMAGEQKDRYFAFF